MPETISPVLRPEELLRQAKVRIDPDTFFLAGLKHEEWTRLLESPELSPRGTEPFMVLRDRFEVTLLLEESDWKAMRYAAREARVEGPFRLLTFDIQLSWEIKGFLALITRILSDAGISVGALSSFTRDHILVKQEDLGATVRILSSKVDEMC